MENNPFIEVTREFVKDNPQILDEVTKEVKEKMDFNNEIYLNSISFQYSKESPWVLKKLHLKIKKGERIGFVGETGSGKSTTLDLIMGLLEPTSGVINIDGKALTNVELLTWRKNIAHVPQFTSKLAPFVAEFLKVHMMFLLKFFTNSF